MTAIAIIGALAASIIALVIALPCEACRKRRERLRAAAAAWRAAKKEADSVER